MPPVGNTEFKRKIRALCLRLQHLFYLPKQLKAEPFGCSAITGTEYILNCTNNVIKITADGKTLYFKEAVRRNSLKKHIAARTHEFFTRICPNAELERKICAGLSGRASFRRLINMGDKTEAGSPLNSYLQHGDERVLGLPPAEAEEKDAVRKFVFYIHGEITDHFNNTGVKKGRIQTFLAVRALAAAELAEMLGLGRLIPATAYVKLTLNGEEKYGVIQEEAAGENAAGIPYGERRVRTTPQLLRELTDLNVLDALTRDSDHRADNYMTVSDGERKYTGVCSFDNDGGNAFFPSASLRIRHCTGCSDIVGRDGKINRPHLSRELSAAVLGLKFRDIKKLERYLTFSQIFCLWQRVSKLKRAIRRTVGTYPHFLLDSEEWSEEHIDEELTGKYGKTYLISFLSDCFYPGGRHPFDIC